MVVSILCGALHGLHAAHEAKDEKGSPLHIVHRDVSPQNILVGVDGVARVIDFGVAKAAGRLQTTRDGQLKGKLAYMAPEQVRGAEVTRQTDIYAVGVVLWELLTGARLFKAENEAHVIARVLEGKVARPSQRVPELPASFDDVVMRAIHSDPTQRYATAREMASDLARCAPAASAPEVGEWMETVAPDDLEQRAARIAEIERSSSMTSALPLETAATGSQVSSVSLAQPTAVPPAPASRHLVRRAVTVCAIGLTAGLAFVVASRTMRGQATSGPPAAPASPVMSETPELAPVHSAAPAVSTVLATDLPSVPIAPPPSPSPARPIQAERPVKRDTGVARSPAPPDCNPPYTTDERGHTHFKPACL